MNKVKEFFKKLAAQIKNTAWIQPILIVIVIFVILFSLNPLTNAIKKGWISLTSVNKMETISYQEYVEKVNNAQDGEKFVVVFTTKGDETCADLFDSMNEFLKGSTYKNGDFKVYNVSLATKSAKAKINDRKYEQYKDSTLGVVSKSNIQSEDAIAQDHLLKLDLRISDFSSRVSSDGIDANGEFYSHITTKPLFIWYESGIETRISNTWNADANGSVSKFNQFITEFEVEGVDLDNWTEEFDLTFAE